jgi:Uma2 family endonuclease
MVAAPSLASAQPTPAEQEPRVLLARVPWAAYVVLRDAIESAGVRMTYLDGLLEIMSPSREHQVDKSQVARLFELFCLEMDIPLYAYGSTTFRKEEKQRGLEPDECYCRGADREIPDVALDVIKTRGSLDKLEVYRGLGVREVWVFEEGKFAILASRGDRYEEIAKSVVFPELDFARLAELVHEPDQHAALKRFRDELRRR